jgi:hypothetical protein
VVVLCRVIENELARRLAGTYTNLDVWFCDLFYNAMEEPLIRDVPTIKKKLGAGEGHEIP